MENAELWVVIPNWKRFQHYSDRDPTFIKDYVSQLHDDDWMSLSLLERGALQLARLMYAAGDGKLRVNTLLDAISVRGRTGWSILESLNHAGLIEFSASKPLALARSREKRREEKTARARARGASPKKTDNDGASSRGYNMPRLDQEAEAAQLIYNDVLTEPFELDVYDFIEPVRSKLLAQLEGRRRARREHH